MKKNGFTLIELLAVIIILVIIAVITIPMLLNVIKKAKLGALKSSTYGIIESASIYLAKNLNNNITDDITFTCNSTGCTSESGQKLEYKGENYIGTVVVKKDGTVAICLSNGDSAATNYDYVESRIMTEVTVTDGGTCSGIELRADDILTKQSLLSILNKLDSTNILTTKNTIVEMETAIDNIINSSDATENDILSGKKAITSSGFITGSASGTNKLVSLGTGTSFNLSSYTNCNSFTIDNFIIEPLGLSKNGTDYGTTQLNNVRYAISRLTKNKAYDSATCVLTTYYNSLGGAHATNYGDYYVSENVAVAAYLKY